ncbi:hypothetical protein SRHO_G00112150 [Serrasalmus rhombeus]
MRLLGTWIQLAKEGVTQWVWGGAWLHFEAGLLSLLCFLVSCRLGRVLKTHPVSASALVSGGHTQEQHFNTQHRQLSPAEVTGEEKNGLESVVGLDAWSRSARLSERVFFNFASRV